MVDGECADSDLLLNMERVDIAISTPGKLVEFIKRNPSVDLQNLQYLVVDEADKLLLQSFNNWIHVVCILSPSHSLKAIQSSRSDSPIGLLP